PNRESPPGNAAFCHLAHHRALQWSFEALTEFAVIAFEKKSRQVEGQSQGGVAIFRVFLDSDPGWPNQCFSLLGISSGQVRGSVESDAGRIVIRDVGSLRGHQILDQV